MMNSPYTYNNTQTPKKLNPSPRTQYLHENPKKYKELDLTSQKTRSRLFESSDEVDSSTGRNRFNFEHFVADGFDLVCRELNFSQSINSKANSLLNKRSRAHGEDNYVQENLQGYY